MRNVHSEREVRNGKRQNDGRGNGVLPEAGGAAGIAQKDLSGGRGGSRGMAENIVEKE